VTEARTGATNPPACDVGQATFPRTERIAIKTGYRDRCVIDPPTRVTAPAQGLPRRLAGSSPVHP
jgi:hypothetical protein